MAAVLWDRRRMETNNISRRRAPAIRHRTGLDDEERSDLVAAVHDLIGLWQPATGRRKAPGLSLEIVVVLF